MAKKFTELTELTTIADDDLFAVTDTSAGASKKITWGNLLKDNVVTTPKINADAVTATKIDWASTGANGGIWWEEIGRTTLGSAGDTITLTTIPARKYLKIIMDLRATGGTVGPALRFNNDSGSNYNRRSSADGGVESTQVSQTSSSSGATNNSYVYANVDVINIATIQKFITGHQVYGDNAAGTAPSRLEWTGKWANTSNQITRVDVINTGTGDFAIGSEVVVLGHD